VLAKILIKTRMAADAVGATMMDRPEWTGARPRVNGFKEIEAYCTLTNNNRRGTTRCRPTMADGSTAAASARPPVDTANPREDNIYGHIIRWREAGETVLATEFTWDLFVQNGDTPPPRRPSRPTTTRAASSITRTAAPTRRPDGLWFDCFGRLWVQTDQVGDGSGDWVNIGANSMVVRRPEDRRIPSLPDRPRTNAKSPASP
jgi:secreted PhoX family phosphatase